MDLFRSDLESGKLHKAIGVFVTRKEWSYDKTMSELLNGGGSYYTGKKKSYQSMHLLRALSRCLRLTSADGDKDWQQFSVMGTGVKRHGLTYLAAIDVRDQIRSVTGECVFLDDTAVYLCLQP